MTDAEHKAKALEAIQTYEAELAAIEQNLTNVKVLREHAPKFREAKQQLDAVVGQLGVQLDVPALDQPRGGACGYTSATMVGQYFMDKYGDGRTLNVDSCPASLQVGINLFLNQVFSNDPVQYTDYAGPPDATYFSYLLSSLRKGAPVLMGTDFYYAGNRIGHYIVITGYNPVTRLFAANDPNGGIKNATQIEGVQLTRENLATHAKHSDGYVLMYYAGPRSFR